MAQSTLRSIRVRSPRRLLGALALGFLLFFVAVPRAAQVYVDSLWFGSLGYNGVFWTTFWIKFALFTGFFAVTFTLLRGAFWWLDRLFSGFALGGTFVRFDNQPVDFEPEHFMKPLALGTAIVWAFISGISMSMRWELFALSLKANGLTAHVANVSVDPIFGRPLAFYLFVWPVRQMLASWLSGVAIIILLASLIYLFFAYASRMPTVIVAEARRTAYRASSLALAGVLCAYAWRAYLGRFSQLWHDHDTFTGIGYVQHHVMLPGLLLVALTLIVAAALAVANAFVWQRPRFLIGALALPLAVYCGLGLVSNYVETLVVKSNERERERPYIQSNIDNTRRAFDLDRVKSREFPARSGVAALALNQNRATLENIRLWDWQALQSTLRQDQQFKIYYDFPDVDVDRYRINGQMRQVMVAARELDVEQLPANSRNWVNLRLVYTHGYGVTMNTANGFAPDGRPLFLLSDMPVQSSAPDDLKVTRPQIYFGQKTDSDVYVKTRQQEFDYPQDIAIQRPADTKANATTGAATKTLDAAGADAAHASTAYAGTGGIEMGGVLRRTLISWTMGDLSKIPFSNDITPQTRVLMYRNIRDRVSRIAPFLNYDNDPYIVVGRDGHLTWIIDAYTSSLYFPYSRHYQTLDGNWTNYLRNSVKVSIDAYDGTVNFYAFDEQDPLVKAYGEVFPGLFKPSSSMPADLRSHLRYPEQMFRAQAEVYSLYHTRDADTFFRREDAWSIATANASPDNAATPAFPSGLMPPGAAGGALRSQPSTSDGPAIDPYFVLMGLPGERASQEFVQVLPFTPVGLSAKNMIGWLAGRSDGEAYGTLVSYNFPKTSESVEGPAQVGARIETDRYLAEKLSLWRTQGSRVLRSDMLVLPLGQSLLYVQPIYLQATQSGRPKLTLVVLATQNAIASGTTFQKALTNLMNGISPTQSSGETAPESTPETSPATQPDTKPVPNTAPAVPLDANRRQLINRAAADLEQYQRLTSAGRYSEAGQRLESLKRNLDQLRRAKN